MTVRNLEGLLHPRRVIVLGEPTSDMARTLVEQLHLCSSLPTVAAAEEDRVLGVVADPASVDAAQLADLARMGCRALVWPHPDQPDAEVLKAARVHTTRILGPRSAGILLPHCGLSVSAMPPDCPKGSLALIVQSQSVAAAALDWARGRNIGFSWVAITGAECDVDIADLLDYAALDPSTRAVALEVGHIRQSRKFMSAARACARSKPVVAIQTRAASWRDKGLDPVRSAAFARAGMVECLSLPGLLDAIAALHRLPALRRARVLVVSNGSGICSLGVDAVLRQNLLTANPTPATWNAARALVPQLRQISGGADLGDCPAEAVVGVLRQFLQDGEVDIVLFVRSPLGKLSHAAMAAAVAQGGFDKRLLTVWLGLETALPARRTSTEANISTFTSPDAAARAVRCRWDYERNRELLTQTPPPAPAAGIDADQVAARLRQTLERGVDELRGADAHVLFESYGLASGDDQPADLVLRVSLRLHPELGLYLRAAPQAAGTNAGSGYGFAPLDTLLAQRILADAGLHGGDGDDGLPAAQLDALAHALVRVAQIGMEQPNVMELDLCLSAWQQRIHCARDSLRVKLGATPRPERERLALAPYPQQLTHQHECHGECYRIRAVRPDDEPALIHLLQGLDPETVRLRFFSYIRHFSHDMAARMTQIDYDRELTLVVLPRDRDDHLFGIGTLIADPDGARAEFALLLDDSHTGLGLGMHLLQSLLDYGRQRGVHTVFGEVLAENVPMLELSRKLGMTVRRTPDDPGCMHVEIDFGPRSGAA
ncbi:MAG: GNAT family N-acetyltransferase [Nevskia sp.]|nr:GNAT family N-acetyltransferase [Nevskia sp.]